MLYFLHKYRIAPIAVQLSSFQLVYNIYTYTNYATRCRYLCNVVHCVKKSGMWFIGGRFYRFESKNLNF
jgi:hypothetical protein